MPDGNTADAAAHDLDVGREIAFALAEIRQRPTVIDPGWLTRRLGAKYGIVPDDDAGWPPRYGTTEWWTDRILAQANHTRPAATQQQPCHDHVLVTQARHTFRDHRRRKDPPKWEALERA
jgi:hypothetical protein